MMRWIVCRNCMQKMVRENQRKRRNANNAGRVFVLGERMREKSLHF
jgi:hypothetical protein